MRTHLRRLLHLLMHHPHVFERQEESRVSRRKHVSLLLNRDALPTSEDIYYHGQARRTMAMMRRTISSFLV